MMPSQVAVTKMPKWMQKILGGRPMHLVEYCFQDVVSKEHVYLYEDCRGRVWLATGKWGWFRVRSNRSK